MVTVKDLIAYRLRAECLVQNVANANMPTRNGDFKIRVFQNMADNNDHVALTKGEWTEDDVVLVRVHSECLTGDVFGSLRCDCGSQLEAALKMIDKEGRGVLLYMRQEGRGIGLVNKVKAYKLQEEGFDTVEANIELGFKADPRDYGIGAQILSMLGIRKMRLITNNPQKRVGIEGYVLEVVEMIPIEIQPNDLNIDYLLTKRNKLGHMLHNLDE
jgi:3,4-dihydroxy 2-butanone 4-phosphate synthase / GTP cyclohydrolase II